MLQSADKDGMKVPVIRVGDWKTIDEMEVQLLPQSQEKWSRGEPVHLNAVRVLSDDGRLYLKEAESVKDEKHFLGVFRAGADIEGNGYHGDKAPDSYSDYFLPFPGRTLLEGANRAGGKHCIALMPSDTVFNVALFGKRGRRSSSYYFNFDSGSQTMRAMDWLSRNLEKGPDMLKTSPGQPNAPELLPVQPAAADPAVRQIPLVSPPEAPPPSAQNDQQQPDQSPPSPPQGAGNEAVTDINAAMQELLGKFGDQRKKKR
jgi:hypothetical protein